MKLDNISNIIVIHELNRTLTDLLIDLQNSRAKMDDKSSDTFTEFMNRTERRIERCKRLINRNLSPKEEPILTMLNINELIDEVFFLLKHELSFKDIKVVKEYESTFSMGLVDKDQIQQVLVNLLLNAKDTIKGGGTITARTKLSADCKNVEIEIADTGEGIPEENTRKVFEPFFTTKKEIGGLGLGLFLCQQIIKKHNGNISVESRVGRGTTFRIKLPYET